MSSKVGVYNAQGNLVYCAKNAYQAAKFIAKECGRSHSAAVILTNRKLGEKNGRLIYGKFAVHSSDELPARIKVDTMPQYDRASESVRLRRTAEFKPIYLYDQLGYPSDIIGSPYDARAKSVIYGPAKRMLDRFRCTYSRTLKMFATLEPMERVDEETRYMTLRRQRGLGTGLRIVAKRGDEVREFVSQQHLCDSLGMWKSHVSECVAGIRPHYMGWEISEKIQEPQDT